MNVQAAVRGVGGSGKIQFVTLDREQDGTIVEVRVVSWGREREEHRGRRWPAGSYQDAKDAVRAENERISVSRN